MQVINHAVFTETVTILKNEAGEHFELWINSKGQYQFNKLDGEEKEMISMSPKELTDMIDSLSSTLCNGSKWKK